MALSRFRESRRNVYPSSRPPPAEQEAFGSWFPQTDPSVPPDGSRSLMEVLCISELLGWWRLKLDAGSYQDMTLAVQQTQPIE